MPGVPTLALTCLVLLAAGFGIWAVLRPTARFGAYARDGLPLLLTEALIVGVFAGVFWVGGLVLDLALLALVFRCMWEAAYVARMRHPRARAPALAIASGAVVLAVLAGLLPIHITAVLAIALVALSAFLRNSNTLPSDPDTNLLLDMGFFPGAPLLLFAAAGMQEMLGAWLLVAFIFVETFDSYALAGGQMFGKTPAFPTLSPRKTVEGLGFGTAALMLTAALAGAAFGLPVLASVAVATLVGALAVAGDLAASALKRRSNVKDFPPVLSRQGGLLDIADAWIAAGAGLVALVALGGLG